MLFYLNGILIQYYQGVLIFFFYIKFYNQVNLRICLYIYYYIYFWFLTVLIYNKSIDDSLFSMLWIHRLGFMIVTGHRRSPITGPRVQLPGTKMKR